MGTALQAGASLAPLALSALGSGLQASGDVQSGIGQSQMYLYQAQVAANNATITRQNAVAESAAGSYAESAKKMETGQLIASQKVAQAANGIDVNVGSAPAVRASAAAIGQMDADMIHFNAAKAAYGLDAEAANLDTQSSLYKQAAANAVKVGKGKAVSSLLAGATSIASKWSQYKQAGVSTPSGFKKDGEV